MRPLLSRSPSPRKRQKRQNKVALEAKFAQLAELRNALRHTRTVDEVTRKEGEAAISWFKQLGAGSPMSHVS